MSDDDDHDIREQTRAAWDSVAEIWARPDDAFEAFARPVSDWILHEAALQPGHRVLELACGPGALGLEAAERVGPAGHVLLSDVSEGMIEQARRRAEAAGATNVDFKVLDAEWIDEPAASFDAIVCRWGLMFPADPEAALRECRRVLRPGARLATSAWDTEERNPWMSIIGAELYEQGLVGEPEPDAPGPMRFARPPDRLAELMLAAGFQEVELEALDLLVEFPNFDAYWDSQSARSSRTRQALELTDDRGRAALREGVERRAAPYRQDDGTLRFPVRPLVAAGTA
jgi:SAM-dependent methyltransferase